MSSLFESRSAVPIFPTLVLARDLRAADRDAINAMVRTKIGELLSERQAPQGRPWQTHTELHNEPEFKAFNDCVLTAASEFLELLVMEESPLEITGCWANISPVGASHHEHSHPNNLFSGVYYVDTAPGSNTITFADPRLQAHVIAPRVKKMTPANASTVMLEAKPGRFFLFPGWLRHSVDVNSSGHERISVSFNVMLSSFTDLQSKPRWKGHLGEAGA